MKPFDPTKPVRTRDGRKARIICTDAKKSNYPVIALVETLYGGEHIMLFDKDGTSQIQCFDPRRHDLVNIPERIQCDVWINIWRGIDGKIGWNAHNSEWYANQMAGIDTIAKKKITIDCEEGEGL